MPTIQVTISAETEAILKQKIGKRRVSECRRGAGGRVGNKRFDRTEMKGPKKSAVCVMSWRKKSASQNFSCGRIQ